MKFLLTGDWHLRKKRPRNRRDDYHASQKAKVKWIIEKASDPRCRAILQPGDLFDSSHTPYSVVNEYGRLFKEQMYLIIISALGQHDMQHHSITRIPDTPHANLQLMNNVKLAGPIPFECDNGVNIYGCSWGEPIPEVRDCNARNILVIHKMFVHDELVWEGQEDYDEAVGFLKAHPEFKLVVSGDNHHGFVVNYRSRHLVNCGSLMRANKDQMYHKPFVVMYDSDTNKLEIMEIPVAPIEEVMDIEAIEEEEERDEELAAFLEEVRSKSTRVEVMDFTRNVYRYMDENNTTGLVRELIEGALEDA